LIFVIVESVDSLYDWNVPDWVLISDELFTLVYIGEVAIKLSVKSFSEYWSSGPNQFDFFTTLLLTGTTLLKYIPFAAVQADLAHYANLLRLLRLLRVVKKLKQYPRVQFMCSTVVRMVEQAGDIISLLGVLLFAFATFSVNFFGGELYEGHPQLEDTEYASKYWFCFNFNDPIMAFGTFFIQLLVEYAPEWAEALYVTSKYGSIAWYVYPTFYLVGVAILFEIFKAFTIETFLALKEEAEKELKELEGEASDDESDEDEELGKDAEARQKAIVENVRARLTELGESMQCRMVEQAKNRSFQKELRAAYLPYLEAADT